MERIAPTLVELSAVAAAGYLWKLPDVKSKLIDIISLYHAFSSTTTRDSEQGIIDKLKAQIPDVMSQKLNDLRLPEIVKKDIQKRIPETSEKLFDWISYLIDTLGLTLDYVQEIYWLQNGEVDQNMIFNCFWVKTPLARPPGENNFDERLKMVYYLACFFGQEQFLNGLQTDIINELRSIFPSLEIDCDADVVFSIMSIVICHYYKESEVDLPKLLNESENGRIEISARKMLEITCSLRLYKAFCYFWKHLDEANQSSYLNNFSNQHLSKQLDFGNENLFLIAMFLTKRMNSSQRINFTTLNFDFLFFKFLNRVSYRKYCLPLLLSSSIRLKYSNSRYFWKTCFKYLANWIRTSGDDYSLLSILEHVMAVSAEVCMLIKLDDGFTDGFDRLLTNALEIFSFPVLKVILNLKNMEHKNVLNSHFGREKFRDLIRNNNFQLLNKFIDEVYYMSEIKKNEFKQSFNFLGTWVKEGRYDLVDNVLNWIFNFNGDVQKKKAIMKARCLKRFCRTVNKDYDSIDKLSSWYFSTDARPLIKDCEDKSELTEFCREIILNMWFSPLNLSLNDSIVRDATKFLTSVFGSEEEVNNFKKNDLVTDETCVRLYLEMILQDDEFKESSNDSFHLVKDDEPFDFERSSFYSNKAKKIRIDDLNFRLVDDFFCFALLSTERIYHIKKLIADNISVWIEKFGKDLLCVDTITSLVNWIGGKIIMPIRGKAKAVIPKPEELQNRPLS